MKGPDMRRVIVILTFPLASMASSAIAAEPISVPLSSSRELPIHDQAGSDWSGFYAGIFGALDTRQGSAGPAVGLLLGVNAQFDFYLLGGEVAVSGLPGGVGDSSYGQILGRAGLVATDNTVIYAAGGYGIDLGPPSEQDVLLGGGVELAITDSVSVRAQYLHGFAIDGTTPKDQFSLGANFHF